LGGLRPPDEYVLRSLERSLADRLEAVRLASVQALGELGPAARRSVPAIVNILEISAPGVQVEAARALWRIEGTTANALPILLTALGNPQAHWQAALVLAEIGPPAQAAIPALVAALELEEVHRPSRTPASAALALARMGPAAVPKLAALLEHPRAAVRIGAAFALAGQGAAAERAVPGLLAMLDEDDGEARTAATNTLGAIGPGARAALPRLRLVARDPDEYLRAMAVAAIARISGAVPGASAADVN
jgi:HEAT repeat protein